ncbi:NAD(P)/FAD-dependent oxidoreductase [Algivirga pacifica]|uniref:Kynurenine 3-monooxygenase n=1 Tax=Algivirga pacifica TaxID=1162670 RepID=A0ABP9DKH8_9BACT
MNKITIIGAGLSGTLLAIMLQQKGYTVEVYERRPDMRQVNITAGRSINLALSERGLRALQKAGIGTPILQEAVPMYGRHIHLAEGGEQFQPYSGRKDECIYSISRGGLNIALMNKLEAIGGCIHFNQKCMGMDYQEQAVTFQDTKKNKTYTISTEAVIGTDGASSAIRKQMMQQAPRLRFSFSQTYLGHGYKELHIPPKTNGGFALDKNALHIWPRGGFMLIALPNKDGSFTVTLFHPFEGEEGLHALEDTGKAKTFFEREFPDALALMPTFEQDWVNNPNSSLATIKCYPWQVEGKSLLLGDAAHAIVPFYGQGMNCSFEDCLVFLESLDKYKGNWEAIFEDYQQNRKKDTDAIADLAEENFYEMRDQVANPTFILKRKLETLLEQKYPEYYSKYSLVTFNPNIPYSEAMRKGRAQDQWLLEYCETIENTENIDWSYLLKQLQIL